MTTPTFREWTVMYKSAALSSACALNAKKGIQGKDFIRWRHISAYILSRIERKEKALRLNAIHAQFDADEKERQAERSRIAERVRGLGKCTIAIEYGDEFLALADDIKEGKV